MSDTPARVPTEHLGQARLFRSRIEEADAVMLRVLRAAADTLTDRMRRSRVPRADTLRYLARCWREQVPVFGRLSRDVSCEGKRLSICCVRLCPWHYRQAGWETRESGIGLMRIVLAIAPRRKIDLSVASVAGVSLHALARRYERGHDVSDAAIIADIHVLAEAYARNSAPDGTSFSVPVADGRWLGTVLDITATDGELQRGVLNVRTFVP